MKWQVLAPTPPNSSEELIQQLLALRGVESEEEREMFFSPPHPFDVSAAELGINETQLEAAVERLSLAKDRGERVLIFGDYDADGICATAVLWEALRAFGIVATPFLPHRERDGYGLSARSLESVFADHDPQLLITVDNGIVAHEAFAMLRERGVETILTDHHQPEVEVQNGSDSKKKKLSYPPADIVIHSTKVCGTGVAWILARAINETAARASLELCAIATIADQMPLFGMNRSFVVHGMDALVSTERVGLQLLLEKAAIDPVDLTTDTLNYTIIPRLNAMGRLKHSLDALRLLCTTNVDRARALVNEVQSTNTRRQELTSEMITSAIARADEWRDERVIVVASAEYHEGVIGLLAGRLVELYGKPAVAIATGGEIAKASARSIPGINITELLREIREELLEVGGHPQAAGFAAVVGNVAQLTLRLQILARERITLEQLTPTLPIDTWLPPSLLTLETADEIDQLSPFGQGNRQPIFDFGQAVIERVAAIGKDSKHLKLSLRFPGLPPIDGLWWSQGERASSLEVGQELRIAGTLAINNWRGRQTLQIVVKDAVATDQ